jgi:hypothetical protein
MLLDQFKHFLRFRIGDHAIAFRDFYEERRYKELRIIRFRATAGFDDERCALEPGFCGFFNQCIAPLLFIRRPQLAGCGGFGRLRRLLAVYASILTDILPSWLISLPKSENPGMTTMVFSFAISASAL